MFCKGYTCFLLSNAFIACLRPLFSRSCERTILETSINLAGVFVDVIEPIFSKLADSDLLCKCLHGQTRNNNESINNVIWKYCPKEVFVSRPAVSDAAHFAVAVFNDGNDAFVKLFEQLGLSGGFTVKSAHSSDITRLYHAKRKSSNRYKITRKRLRAEKKGFIDSKNEEEGNVYESGAH